MMDDFKRISELIPAQYLKGPTAVDLRLVNAASEIRESQPDDISYQHTVFCQTGLPYKQTDARRYEKRNGRVMLETKRAGHFTRTRTNTWTCPCPTGRRRVLS